MELVSPKTKSQNYYICSFGTNFWDLLLKCISNVPPTGTVSFSGGLVTTSSPKALRSYSRSYFLVKICSSFGESVGATI